MYKASGSRVDPIVLASLIGFHFSNFKMKINTVILKNGL